MDVPQSEPPVRGIARCQSEDRPVPACLTGRGRAEKKDPKREKCGDSF
jgi:hypothetical protein